MVRHPGHHNHRISPPLTSFYGGMLKTIQQFLCRWWNCRGSFPRASLVRAGGVWAWAGEFTDHHVITNSSEGNLQTGGFILWNIASEGKNNRHFCYNNWRHVGEQVERSWLSIRRSACNRRSTCWGVLMCCKKNFLSYSLKKYIFYSTYSSFIVINVCNQGKNLCSPCTFRNFHISPPL